MVSEMSGGVGAVTFEASVCYACKYPYVDIGRALCASCLTRNLQRACKRSATSSPATPPSARGSPRALFPGMPRAVLSPSDGDLSSNVERRSTTNGWHRSSGVNCEKIAIHCDGKILACELSSEAASPQSANSSKSSAVEMANENHGLSLVDRPFCQRGSDEEGGCIANSVGSAFPGEDGTTVVEKWQLFQVQKHLTVKIPNPASEMSNLHFPQPLLQPQTKRNYHGAQPLQKQALPKNVYQRKPRKWTFAPDANAEADLMMRLLADTMPMLKSTAPLVLPHCEVKPPPILSPSPPGDPLWKRRCIPCPKSLNVQTSSVCVI